MDLINNTSTYYINWNEKKLVDATIAKKKKINKKNKLKKINKIEFIYYLTYLRRLIHASKYY